MNSWKILGIVLIIGLILALLLNHYGFLVFNDTSQLLIIDESKNKLAVIVKKNGIYDTPELQNKIDTFLQAVEQDLNIESIGISYADINSTDELDKFVEQLYHEKNVGYIIMIGEDLFPEDNINSDINEELAYIKEKEAPQEFTLYSDIAISYIISPASNTTQEKIDFISNIISTYTSYHINSQKLLSQFEKSYLYIIDPSFTRYPAGYQLAGINLENTQYTEIGEEMKKGHLCLLYFVHGSKQTIGIGLSGGTQDNDKTSTTLEEYSNFIKNNDLPALFVEAHHCGNKQLWALENMKQDVWAYYLLSGPWSLGEWDRGDLPPCGIRPMQKAFSESPFIGYAVRHCLTDTTFIYGDITAHMT